MTAANDLAVRRALEGAGVEFIDENGGGPGSAPQGKAEARDTEKIDSWRSATWTRLDADFAEQTQFSLCAPQQGEASGRHRKDRLVGVSDFD